jgi:hypothetical protein
MRYSLFYYGHLDYGLQGWKRKETGMNGGGANFKCVKKEKKAG